jgi:unsaturated chondroitin disaccharide hydrolase
MSGRYLFFWAVLVILVVNNGCRNTRDVVFERSEYEGPLKVDSLLNHFVLKYQTFLDSFHDSTRFPRSYDHGNIIYTNSSGWTSGFFPGILWNLYHYSGEKVFYDAAMNWTLTLLSESRNTSTHNVGFIINSSVSPAYNITGDDSLKNVILKAAESLASRYNETQGCIKSLDNFNDYSYPVLIDNLVNLEILFKAWKWTGDNRYYHIAYSHALKTMENQTRKDFSAYQLVDYDVDKGFPVYKGTFQGYSASSVWSRGQAWGIYGYTMAYRETNDRIFLDQAERMADFILNDPYFKDGYIPFWDMLTPEVPHELRDASAAAILASAFIELSTFLESSGQEKYFKAGENILLSLANSEYCSGMNENSFFIVKHCVGNYPGKIEVDVPLIYADYYLLEALLKYQDILEHTEDE